MAILVIYFSQTGTTKGAAEKIAGLKKADLVEIKPQRPYEMSYGKTVLTSMKEIFTKARPTLAMEIPDVQKYDRILIGFPVWCGVALEWFIVKGIFAAITIQFPSQRMSRSGAGSRQM